MNILILHGLTLKIKRDFLKVPRFIYNKKDCPQDRNTEKLILSGKHALSKDLQVMPFVAYENSRLTARCLVTFYENDNNAYLGYFDSVNDTTISSKLFKEIEAYIKENNKESMIGPVDASFWIGYRFRIMENQNEGYNRHFTGEPYNKDYYISLWKDYGFDVLDTYKSNMYRHMRKSDIIDKYSRRMSDKILGKYIIRSSSFDTFDYDLEKIYYLLTKLYSGFPIYKHIELNQFKELFKSYKRLLHLDMVKLAFRDGELVGFIICFPDYGNSTLGVNNLRKLVKMYYSLNNVTQYVVMYMGVDSRDLGLGMILASDINHKLRLLGCSSIGALIKQGKVTGAYYRELITDTVEYVTLRKKVEVTDEI